MTQQQSRIEYVAGVAGSDPEYKQSRIGDLLEFRLAVTRSYPRDGQQYGDTEWMTVVVKNPGLQQTVQNEVYKGAKVVVQGTITVKQYNEQDQVSMWADRIGLVEWMRKEQVAQPAAINTGSAGPDDELGF